MNKLFSMLGICRKAGKLVLGTDAVAEAAHKQALHLILLSQDLSRRSREKIMTVASNTSVIVIQAPLTMDDVAALTGKAAGIVGISDKGLADAVKDIAARMNEEDTVC